MNVFGITLSLLAALSMGASFQIIAEQKPTQQEITQLLLRFDKNKCKVQQGAESLSSLDSKKLFKQQLHANQQLIHSAEDFIRLATSVYLSSGQPINLHCHKLGAISSHAWFSAQLAEHRITKGRKGQMF